MPNNQNLRDVDRAFIHAVMFKHGILPMENTHLDMRRALQQLPPDEARTLKRKFRKVWRKAMRAVTAAEGKRKNAKDDAMKATLGVEKHVPSRFERQARKQLVFDTMWTDIIAPMLAQFENAGKPPVVKAKKAKKTP